MRTAAGLRACALVAAAALAFAVLAPPASAAVPPGFTDELVDNMDQAISLAFLPDGRMLISTQRRQRGPGR